MKKLTTHPQLKNLLPPLTESEYSGLEADILQHGCLSPIAVWNNIIVDGHARHAICEKYGLPFDTKKIQFDTLDDAMFWAWTHQEHRRNMTPYQRSEIALRFKPMIAAKANQNQRLFGGDRKSKSVNDTTRTPVIPCHTYDEVAKIAGVSHDTVRKAEYLHDHADEETKQRLRNGQTTINREYSQLKESAAPMLAQPVSVPIRKVTSVQISPKNAQELIETIADRFGVVDLEQLILGLVEQLHEVRCQASFSFFLKKLRTKYGQ